MESRGNGSAGDAIMPDTPDDWETVARAVAP